MAVRRFGGPTKRRYFSVIGKAKIKAKSEKQPSMLRALFQYQREMIANPSPLETALENALFDLKIPYLAQEIIEPYIVDICIRGEGIKKIIEADGYYHEAYKQRQDDAKRDRYLQGLGYSVMHLRRHEFYNVGLMKQRISEFVFDTKGLTGPSSRTPGSETLDERFDGQHKPG